MCLATLSAGEPVGADHLVRTRAHCREFILPGPHSRDHMSTGMPRQRYCAGTNSARPTLYEHDAPLHRSACV